MNYLSVEELSKSYGINTLFEGISFGIDKGHKVALVARNGTGKSTLLRILAGEETQDKGRVVYNKSIKTGYLSQSPYLDNSLTVHQSVLNADMPEIRASEEYNRVVEKGGDGDEMQKAIEKMDRLKAWDIEAKAEQVLNSLKIHNTDQPVDQLSGGQRKRVALAKVLIEEPDFLILDEPTNHLDLEMIEWLENYLTNTSMTLFMVTHDRYFLERVCDHIVEMESGEIHTYSGNYGYFLEKKAERESHEAAVVQKAKNLMRKELEWMRRMPKARATKAKYRQDAFYDLKDKASSAPKEKKLDLDVNMQRLGGKILEIHHLRKSYDDFKIIDDFNYVFKRGDKIGIVGKNGVGKTTFLDMLCGRVSPDGGKIVIGETVKFGYYTQKGIQLAEDKRVIEVIKEIAEVIPLKKGRSISASQFLEKFLFPKEMHYQLVSKLSGGEKKRLYLMTILVRNPNFLILDEPTNDLDILTLNVLEDFLFDFEGCLIVVTHDRYFMDKLTNQLFVFEGDGLINGFMGSYSQLREIQKQRSKKRKKPEKGQKKQEIKNEPNKGKKQKKKLSYKYKLEFEKLGKEIDELEKKKEKLTAEMNAEDVDYDELQKLGEEMEKVVEMIGKKSDRWLELSEMT